MIIEDHFCTVTHRHYMSISWWSVLRDQTVNFELFSKDTGTFHRFSQILWFKDFEGLQGFLNGSERLEYRMDDR